MQLSVQSAYANKALFFFRNKEALAVLCSVAKHSLELLEHSSCWGNVRRGRRTGFRFRLTGKARLVVKKKGEPADTFQEMVGHCSNRSMA